MKGFGNQNEDTGNRKQKSDTRPYSPGETEEKASGMIHLHLGAAFTL